MAQSQIRLQPQHFTGEEIEIILIQIKLHICRSKMVQIVHNLTSQRIILNDLNFKGIVIHGHSPNGAIKVHVQFQSRLSTNLHTYWTTLKELDAIDVPWTMADE